ncbi:MAG: TolC family protein [Flavisolibacter sp.]
MKPKEVFSLLAIFISCMHAHAQDTLKLTLSQAEEVFAQKNLSLLAEKYNIEIARAQVIQARLYSNPNFKFTGNLYNPQLGKKVDFSNKTGEYIIEAQQLVLLAGKRNKQVRLAETNTSLSENRFYDLLRTLKYTLRSDFYRLFYLQNSINAYGTQIGYLEKLNGAYQDLLSNGVVTLKDAVRIKSLLYSLKSEQTTLLNQAGDLNGELQILVHNNAVVIVPVVEDFKDDINFRSYALANLIDTATVYRQDLKLAQNTVLFNQQNYALQKALATPDLTLGGEFDRRGSYVENASFFTVAIDLPFFNRNQGNIRAARTSVDQSKLLVQKQQETIQNEVQTAYLKLLNTDQMVRAFDPAFKTQLDKLLQGVTENFQKKNISLLEFVDFYESYKTNILQFNEQQTARRQAIEDLHFSIGKTIFNF